MAGRRRRSLQRIKKSHGPDFEEEFSPSKQQRWMNWEHDDQEEEEEDPDEEMPDEMDDEPVCDFCLRVNNKAGKEEELLYCKDCTSKGECLFFFSKQTTQLIHWLQQAKVVCSPFLFTFTFSNMLYHFLLGPLYPTTFLSGTARNESLKDIANITLSG